ncbi:MAG: PhnD/SsuA/transferrin family substrate-binding protein [Syntrophomonadaceae bacterium]|nr:PhnD/SsuA/transferrin family substrate-binding protein [Syntrophomonadaceae bacterium]
MKKISLMVLAAFFMSILVTGCGSNSAGVKEPNTITVAWLPNNSGDDFKNVRAEFDKVIEKATGKKVEDKLTTDYAVLIEAIANGNAQIAYCGAQQYIEAHDKNNQVVPLVVNSGDSGTLKDAMYYSRIAVKKGNEDQYKSGSGYSIDNIVGKKMSFVSNSSTSGFKVPASAIISNFSKQEKWKSLKQEDLLEGGSDKFFSQVLFGGSHQLSLVNILSDKAEVAAVDDIDVETYVDLTSGNANAPGAVYTVRNGAAAPFDKLAGSQFVIIKSMAVMNAPFVVNSGYLKPETIEALQNAFISDEVTNNPKIFLPKDSKDKGIYKQPQRFLKVEDSWYNPIRELSN